MGQLWSITGVSRRQGLAGLVPGPGLNLNTYSRLVLSSSSIVNFHSSLNSFADSTTGKKTLLPPKPDPYARALVRLQADRISRTLVLTFYRFLQAQDLASQMTGARDFSSLSSSVASVR